LKILLNPINTEFEVKLKEDIKMDYSDEILEAVRQNIGLKADDESKDDEIAEMSKEEVLDRVFNWNGLIGYGSAIKQWIEDIYGVNLEDE